MPTETDNALADRMRASDQQYEADLQLCERAAAAVGVKVRRKLAIEREYLFIVDTPLPGSGECWCPLDDDQQAFQLLIVLDLSLSVSGDYVQVGNRGIGNAGDPGSNRLFLNARRMIVEAAALAPSVLA